MRRLFTTKRISVLAALLFLTCHCYAQIDLKVVQPSPINGQTITYGTPFNVTLRLVNKSSTPISSSTSVILKTYIVKGSVTDTITGLSFIGALGAIAAYDSLSITIPFSYTNFTTSYTAAPFCQKAILQGNTDPDLTNNTACANVKLVYVSPGTGGHNTGTPQYSFFQNTTGANTIPFTLPSVNKAQWLYLSSELTNTAGKKAPSGKITKIYLRTADASAIHKMTSVKISLGQTTASTFTSTSFITGLKKLFDSATYSISTPGWIEFALSTPFQFDSTKNLIIEATGDNGFYVAQQVANNSRRITGANTATTGSINGSQAEFGIDLAPKLAVHTAMSPALIRVYPNPVTSLLMITSDDAIVGTFALTDVNGKLVVCQSLSGKDAHVAVSSVASGSYLYKISNGAGAVIAKGKINVQH